ncbi:hypothetical protein [Undibacterium umbellatum]|uniref:hypothetical protein n=1 Tax=Undibacterium umbellatum TaxID=2762300 RepID=UPI00164C3D43|nr:hypothetical protein [Undibacterium umbellatum]
MPHTKQEFSKNHKTNKENQKTHQYELSNRMRESALRKMQQQCPALNEIDSGSESEMHAHANTREGRILTTMGVQEYKNIASAKGNARTLF